MTAPRQQPQRLVVQARRLQQRPEAWRRPRLVPVRQQHLGVLGAEPEFDQPVLVRLETGRRAERVAERQIVGRRHGRQHVPGVDQLLLDAGDAGQRFEGRRQMVGADRLDGGFQFVRHQLEPQLLHMVDHHKGELVMLLGQRLLGGQQGVELQIVAIGLPAGEVEMHLGFDAAVARFRFVHGGRNS